MVNFINVNSHYQLILMAVLIIINIHCLMDNSGWISNR